MGEERSTESNYRGGYNQNITIKNSMLSTRKIRSAKKKKKKKSRTSASGAWVTTVTRNCATIVKMAAVLGCDAIFRNASGTRLVVKVCNVASTTGTICHDIDKEGLKG